MIEQQNTAVVPAARIDDLVITEADDEVLVYDKQRHQIHHLNQTSAVIWRLCDGTRTITNLSQSASSALDVRVDEATTRMAIAKLSAANLLVHSLPVVEHGSVQSRRKLLRRAAVAGAVAVPAIISMTAPSAVMAVGCSTQTVFPCNAGQSGKFCCTSDALLGVCTQIQVGPPAVFACVAV